MKEHKTDDKRLEEQRDYDIHDIQDWISRVATLEEIQDTIGFARGVLAARPKRAPRKDKGTSRTPVAQQEKLI